MEQAAYTPLQRVSTRIRMQKPKRRKTPTSCALARLIGCSYLQDLVSKVRKTSWTVRKANWRTLERNWIRRKPATAKNPRRKRARFGATTAAGRHLPASTSAKATRL